MKVVMNMVRTPYIQGDVIFDISEKSDDLYLIHTGTVQIESSEGLALATLEQARCSVKWHPFLASASAPPGPSP